MFSRTGVFGGLIIKGKSRKLGRPQASLAGLLVVGICFAAVSAHSVEIKNRDAIIDQKLNVFLSRNPVKIKAEMNAIPPKYDRNGDLIKDSYTLFYDGDRLEGNGFVELKDLVRRNQLGVRPEERSGIERNDEAKSLLGEAPAVQTLREMENSNLLTQELPTQPWSDDYWAIYSGVTAKRYADRLAPSSSAEEWKSYTDYILNSLGGRDFNAGNGCSLDELSPAEKYDLIVGDKDFTLTKAQIAEGKPYFDSYGKVESWMGICHGWAPAAYMLPRPQNAVAKVKTPFGVTVKWYPADIKALATLLWANASDRETRFMGGRCGEKKPKQDENGRVLDQECFDDNPGAFHLAVVNSIGVKKRSFVMDVTYDYEVWNQPVFSYNYSYFNPATRRRVGSLEKATINRADFADDLYAKYRDRNTVKMVGIVMDVTYLVETTPTHRERDSEYNDSVFTAQYMYDLELDRNDRIIGGEWYTNVHPDFLWTPAPTAKALSYADRYLDSVNVGWNWNPTTEEMPEAWRNAALQVSPYSMPLARAVDSLIAASLLK